MSIIPAGQIFFSNHNPQRFAAVATHRTLGPKATKPLLKHTVSGKAKMDHGAATNTSAKATRPLNSWMAFRSYYSTLFTHLQQKDISGFLVYMWQSDPFKAKWAILAKAYSVIRDQEGKENAPLDKFLFINSNLIGIVAPKSYMVILGWVIAPVDGQLMLRRDLKFNPNSIDTRLLTTNLSVDDVVKHNYNNGYIMGAPSAAAAFGNGPSLTMATSAQPPSQNEATNGHAGETPDLEEGSGSVHHAEGSQAQLNLAENLTTTLTLSPRFDPDNHSPMALQYINSRVPDPSVDPPISSLVNTAYHLSGDYPFTPDFDPDLPGQIFDPFLGNQFNAFNMSDWVDEEAF